MSLSYVTYYVEIITTGNNETFDNIICITLRNKYKVVFKSYIKSYRCNLNYENNGGCTQCSKEKYWNIRIHLENYINHPTKYIINNNYNESTIKNSLCKCDFKNKDNFHDTFVKIKDICGEYCMFLFVNETRLNLNCEKIFLNELKRHNIKLPVHWGTYNVDEKGWYDLRSETKKLFIHH